ncbi:ImmA/IrrE family metallo-endopeptidase [Paenibacillus periandrae]|uniref:ImmA/IrrE family metallo-endopeptidase n=1 Tax=Paenibacillus periandrae TaxID=1761741 RepID=UPI001F098BB1|nr:ImmA/IrrE family metallo-endopeptidase [Paenibacillus periandrae]
MVNMVKKLIQLHGTNDPFRIASMRNILVLYEYLGKSTWGYFSCVNRIPIIHLHELMKEAQSRFTCAHELAHSLLHPKVNTPYLKAHTLQSIDKVEREANQFAVELLISDELLLTGMTIYDAAVACGVPEEVAHLKSKPERKLNLWTNEDSFINL